jgi:hypothetical protein
MTKIDMPPNFSRDPKVGPKAKTSKKKKLELQGGTTMNSQARVQNDINSHYQKKRAVNASRMEVV